MVPLHRFEKHLRRKGHYPRFYRNGTLVEVAPGYVRLQRGGTPMWIPKSTLIPLLKWLIPLVKEMGESFDVDASVSEYILHEDAIRRETKALKKAGRSRVPRHQR